MAKFRIILFLLVITAGSYSQIVGTKFIADSSYYKESGNFWINPPPTNIYVYNTQYILGDTIIGNKYYQKLYCTGRNKFDTICKGAMSLLYHDSDKVYYNNKLVYNFNLVLGDTLNIYYPSLPVHPAGYYTYTVTTKDSIYIGNKWRKQITFTGPTIIPVKLRWVDGLGDLYYGIAPSYSSIDFYKMLGGTYTLTCFSEHFQNTYGNGCGVNSFCGDNNLTSVIPCSPEYSSITFSLNGGTAPYSFNIQTPSACSTPNYTAAATSTNPTFTLSCSGVYTFTVKDSNNNSLGITTHTATNSSIINFNVISTKDTICSGESTSLSINGSTSSYTVNPINWNDGSVGSPIFVSPVNTYTYSVSGLYTSTSTRTCSVTGFKKIVVNPCIGIKEYEINKLQIYPNPSSSIITILGGEIEFRNSEIEIVSYLGQTVFKMNYKNEIDVSELSNGCYFITITNQEKQPFHSKFIKE